MSPKETRSPSADSSPTPVRADPQHACIGGQNPRLQDSGADQRSGTYEASARAHLNSASSWALRLFQLLERPRRLPSDYERLEFVCEQLRDELATAAELLEHPLPPGPQGKEVVPPLGGRSGTGGAVPVANPDLAAFLQAFGDARFKGIVYGPHGSNRVTLHFETDAAPAAVPVGIREGHWVQAGPDVPLGDHGTLTPHVFVPTYNAGARAASTSVHEKGDASPGFDPGPETPDGRPPLKQPAARVQAVELSTDFRHKCVENGTRCGYVYDERTQPSQCDELPAFFLSGPPPFRPNAYSCHAHLEALSAWLGGGAP